MGEVCWLSVDPVRRKIDFYPRAIAMRVEKAFNERDQFSPSACVLGSDFFNATVHFHPSGSCYQTTPGMSMGRAGFKQPGYRSVKRMVKPADGSGRVIIYSKQVHGEWRIAANAEDSEVTFDESWPSDCMVPASADASPAAAQVAFRPWTGADLQSGAWDVSVVIWQWCRGVPERHGNLLALGDDWWCPYLSDANGEIEAAFASQQDTKTIQLLERTLAIKFTAGQTFALQRDEARGKERTVRRVVKTVQELKAMLDKMATPPMDPAELSEMLPQGSIPHQFFCPIFQEIMNDPVKTIDGHTYDRPAIERWFTYNSTSPLTGLPLSSKALVSNAVLRDQISAFVAQHQHLRRQASADAAAVGIESLSVSAAAPAAAP